MALQHLRSSTANKRPLPANMADGQVAVNTNTSSPGLFVKDSAAGLLKIGPTHIGTTAPNLSPAAGGATGNTVAEQWLDTSGANPLLKVWDGSAWRTVQPVTTGTVVSTTDVGTITSTMILDETIANVDISTTASIAHSKLASITAGRVLLGNASNVPTATTVSGDVTITSAGVTTVSNGAITNAKVSASAGIVDTKLATISTAGKVSNSATTATNGNTANAIVARDANGNFSAGTISASLNGNASTATNASTVTTNANLTGDVTSVGNATSIASGVIVNADISASAAIADTKLATISTAGKVSGAAITSDSINTSGQLNITNAAPTVSLTESDGIATHSQTMIVRDGNTFQIQARNSAGSFIATDYSIVGSVSGATDHRWSVTGSERMRIGSSGFVGIGTTAPQARLEIARLGGNLPVTGIDGNVGILVTPGGGVSTSGALINCVGGNTGIAGLYFGTASSPSTGRIWQDNDSLSLRFSTNASERLRITSTGSVGIGTTSPGSLLDVAGNVTAVTVLAKSGTSMRRDIDTDFLGLYGGSTTTTGGNIIVYGASHATSPNRILIRQAFSNRIDLATAGAITLTSGGTNQNITLTPSGTGTVNAPTFNATSTTAGGFQGIGNDTVATPSFTWTGDLDTGIYRSNANEVGIAGGGVVCARFGGTVLLSKNTFLFPVDDAAANATTTTRTSSTLNWRGKYWNGTASVNTDWNTVYVPSDTVGNGQWRLRNGTSNRLTVDNSGTVTATTFNATSTTDGGFQGIATDSAAAPSFTWTGDTDTGIFRPTTDVLAVTTAGSERLRITSAGNVGIGTTSPGANLQIGNGSSATFGSTAPYAWVSARANSTGNNPTTPQELLRLSWQEGSQDLGSGEGCAINFAASLVGDSGTFYPVASIASFKETSLDTERTSALTFSTSADGTAAPTEQMRISSNGNVGIGTTTPGSALQVQGLITGSAVRSISDTLPTLDTLVQVGTDTSLIYKGRITSGENLNDYYEPGIYRINSGADAGGIANTPATNSGAVLEVISPDPIRSRGSLNLAIQRYTQRTRGGATETWVRNSNSTTTDGWSDWQIHYTSRNILGTVSQSGGVPTGAIIERGSNANGEFVKYADGTLICTGRVTIDHTGSLSSSTRLFGTWTFPVQYATGSFAVLSMDCGSSSSANYIGCSRDNVVHWSTDTRTNSTTIRTLSIFFTGGVSTTDARVENINLIGIGRWF